MAYSSTILLSVNEHGQATTVFFTEQLTVKWRLAFSTLHIAVEWYVCVSPTVGRFGSRMWEDLTGGKELEYTTLDTRRQLDWTGINHISQNFTKHIVFDIIQTVRCSKQCTHHNLGIVCVDHTACLTPVMCNSGKSRLHLFSIDLNTTWL